MKELSIEQKAQRYDEAIKRIENINTGKCETKFIFTEGLFEHIFPELKENGDERIREMLIEFFGMGAKCNSLTNGIADKDIIAWLEKQGESSNQIHYWTEEEIEPIISDYLRGAETYGGMIGRLRCLKPKSLEKQGEQKPVDKIEPKFHEGYWEYGPSYWEKKYHDLKERVAGIINEKED